MRVFAGAEKNDVTVIFNAEKKLENDKINVRFTQCTLLGSSSPGRDATGRRRYGDPLSPRLCESTLYTCHYNTPVASKEDLTYIQRQKELNEY